MNGLSARVTLASLFLTLAACGESDQTIDITFDPCESVTLRAVDATDAQLESIEVAAGMWNQWGTRLRVAGPADDAAEQAAWEIPVGFQDASPIFFGVYRDELGDVVINSSLDDTNERAIAIAHELGHAFALPHVDDRDSVMNQGNLERPPDGADAEDLSATWPDCDLTPSR